MPLKMEKENGEVILDYVEAAEVHCRLLNTEIT